MEEIGMKWMLRIAIGFLSLLILAIAALFVLGHRTNAGRVHASAEFNASAEQIWPWLSEGDKAKQWVSWLVEVRPLTPAASGVGSKEVWVMHDANNGGQPMEIESACTEYEPPTRLSVRLSSSGSFDGHQTYRLVNLDNGRARLDIDGQYHFSQWFAALMEPVVTPAAEKKLVGDVARLKSLIERGANNGATSSAF
jgi:uncharacterized protein YndB with AHSA1/START domain